MKRKECASRQKSRCDIQQGTESMCVEELKIAEWGWGGGSLAGSEEPGNQGGKQITETSEGVQTSS